MRTIDIGQIKGYEKYTGKYIVHDDGQVWSVYKKEYLTQHQTKKGYRFVDLWLPGVKTAKHARVNRLVALAFVPNPNPENLTQVGHDDDNKDNNNWTNLYWTDALENNGREGRNRKIRKAVYCVELNQTFDSLTAAAAKLNLSTSNICNCLKGRIKTSGGYHWQYAETSV